MGHRRSTFSLLFAQVSADMESVEEEAEHMKSNFRTEAREDINVMKSRNLKIERVGTFWEGNTAGWRSVQKDERRAWGNQRWWDHQQWVIWLGSHTRDSHVLARIRSVSQTVLGWALVMPGWNRPISRAPSVISNITGTHHISQLCHLAFPQKYISGQWNPCPFYAPVPLPVMFYLARKSLPPTLPRELLHTCKP